MMKINNTIYITRDILELCRKLNIEIEGAPKIINKKNCYSIHYKDLKKLESKLNLKGIEEKISEKKRTENIIIVYKDVNENKLYKESKSGKEDKLLLNKSCIETTYEELENDSNQKYIIIPIFSIDKIIKNKEKITICSYNDILYIGENELRKANITPHTRKKIKVQNTNICRNT